jgi:hypothetical protein
MTINRIAASSYHAFLNKMAKKNWKKLAEEQSSRENIMSEQIKAWRSVLPVLIKNFSHIRDKLDKISTKN